MELVHFFFDLIVNVDKHLEALTAQYGVWIYAILFAIIFCETGLVVTPFLPGDSLLFVAGTIAAVGGMNVHLLVVLLIVAGVLGDAINYFIGRKFGEKILASPRSWWIKREHIDRTHAFFERHGGKTIIIARFMPIVRTYAPFVAGLGQMTYRQFGFYNVIGAVLWVVSLTYAGYVFGNIPAVKRNLEFVIFGIIIASISPAIYVWLKAKLGARAATTVE